MRKYLLFFLIMASLSFFAGCKEEGTDTGNPGYNQDFANCGSARCLATPFIQIQAGVICQSLHRCSGLAESECQKNLWNLDGLDREIRSTARTYADLTDRLNSHHLAVDGSAFNSSLKSVKEISCADPILVDAYDVTNPEDLSRVHGILRINPDCHEVYTDI